MSLVKTLVYPKASDPLCQLWQANRIANAKRRELLRPDIWDLMDEP